MSVTNDSCHLATANSSPVTSLPQILWQCLNHSAAKRNQAACDIHWVVAFSGGKDSTALALAMTLMPELLSHVTLMHIHHGLQPEADNWLAHCQGTAQMLGFAFYGQKVVVDTAARQSIEASARQARYNALREYCRAHNGVLLLAQHEDDQLETVLLQLKRGAGPKGLSGMAKEQEIDGVLQIRPWLACSQRDIVEFINEHNVHCIHDPSNDDTRFDRNFLRNDVLPLLTKRWDGLAKAVARSAALCAQQNKLIEQQVEAWLTLHAPVDRVLPEQALMALSEAWQAETLRYWCNKCGVTSPSHDQLHAFLDALQASSDKQPHLNFRSAVLRRFSGNLYLQKGEIKPLYDKFEQHVPLENDHFLPVNKHWGIYTEWASKFCEPSTQKSADYVFALSHNQTISVQQMSVQSRVELSPKKRISGKKLFKQKRIVPWLRDHTLGLFCDQTLVALINELGIYPISNTLKLAKTNDIKINETSSPLYLVVSHYTTPDQLD